MLEIHILGLHESPSRGTRRSWRTKVSGLGEPQYVEISDPFLPHEEERLRWSFEDMITYDPMNVREGITGSAMLASYRDRLLSFLPELHAGPSQAFHFKIEGSPAFQSLHWETLAPPIRSSSGWNHVTRRVLIKSRTSRLPKDLSPQHALNILLIVARSSKDFGYTMISRPLVDIVNGLNAKEQHIRLDLARPGSFTSLQQSLQQRPRGYYQMVHFDMHGEVAESQGQSKASLRFADGTGTEAVDAQTIADLLAEHDVTVAVLNACQTGVESKYPESCLARVFVERGVPFVIAMRYEVTVRCVEIFVEEFYRCLLRGGDVLVAIAQARQKLALDKERNARFSTPLWLEDWVIPVVYHNGEIPRIHLDAPFTTTPTLALHLISPIESCIGREIDILNIENLLLSDEKYKILLIHGFAGVGKSALLRYIIWWWQSTGLVNRAFRFSFQDRAWTRKRLMLDLDEKLFPSASLDSRRPPFSKRETRVLEALNEISSKALFVLDDLQLAREGRYSQKNRLDKRQQDDLHELLRKLRGTRCLLLLSSRQDESSWLPLHNRTYALEGLDRFTGVQMAKMTLLARKIPLPDDASSVEDLACTVLGGLPLSIELVLPLLQHCSPEDLLQSLTKEGLRLDQLMSVHPTLTFVDDVKFFFGHLPPDLRDSMIWLAPFSTSPCDIVSYFQLVTTEEESIAESRNDFRLESALEFGTKLETYGYIMKDATGPFWRIHPVLLLSLRRQFRDLSSLKRRSIERTFAAFQGQLAAESNLQNLSYTLRHFVHHSELAEFDNMFTAFKFAFHHKDDISCVRITNFLALRLRHWQYNSQDKGTVQAVMHLLDMLQAVRRRQPANYGEQVEGAGHSITTLILQLFLKVGWPATSRAEPGDEICQWGLGIVSGPLFDGHNSGPAPWLAIAKVCRAAMLATLAWQESSDEQIRLRYKEALHAWQAYVEGSPSGRARGHLADALEKCALNELAEINSVLKPPHESSKQLLQEILYYRHLLASPEFRNDLFCIRSLVVRELEVFEEQDDAFYRKLGWKSAENGREEILEYLHRAQQQLGAAKPNIFEDVLLDERFASAKAAQLHGITTKDTERETYGLLGMLDERGAFGYLEGLAAHYVLEEEWGTAKAYFRRCLDRCSALSSRKQREHRWLLQCWYVLCCILTDDWFTAEVEAESALILLAGLPSAVDVLEFPSQTEDILLRTKILNMREPTTYIPLFLKQFNAREDRTQDWRLLLLLYYILSREANDHSDTNERAYEAELRLAMEEEVIEPSRISQREIPVARALLRVMETWCWLPIPSSDNMAQSLLNWLMLLKAGPKVTLDLPDILEGFRDSLPHEEWVIINQTTCIMKHTDSIEILRTILRGLVQKDG